MYGYGAFGGFTHWAIVFRRSPGFRGNLKVAVS